VNDLWAINLSDVGVLPPVSDVGVPPIIFELGLVTSELVYCLLTGTV
jgi:hypothetical protein